MKPLKSLFKASAAAILTCALAIGLCPALAFADASVQRVSGPTAAETSAAISQQTFEETEWVVVARDDDFADAMSATGLAGALKCPIVLTNRTELSDAAAAEIERLGATSAYVIGGAGAVKEAVVDGLEDLGLTVERVKGKQSWDTSVACAEKIAFHGGNKNGDAIVAMSSNFQDALSISSFAYKYQIPILLQTSGRTFTAEADAILDDVEGIIYIVGGNGAVPTASVEDVYVTKDTIRMSGKTGYDTSLAIAEVMVEHGMLTADVVCVASGAQKAKGSDALSGAALAGLNGGVMLLVSAQPALEAENYAGMMYFLETHAGDISQVYVLGGRYVIPDDTIEVINDVLGNEAPVTPTADLGYVIFDGTEGYEYGEYVEIADAYHYVPYYGAGAYVYSYLGDSENVVLPQSIDGSKIVYVEIDASLKSLDVTACSSLVDLCCFHNELTELDISKNPQLKSLDCSSNELTKLDISKNPKLEVLYCENNKLTELDVSAHTALVDLMCYGNELTELDLSNNAELVYLDCDENYLTTLDLSNNPNLVTVYCAFNLLTSIDVSKCTALDNITLSANPIAAIDLSANVALTELICYNTELTELDVTNNTALMWLNCGRNQLTEHDLSNNAALVYLNFTGNMLTSVDFSPNPNLTVAYCSDNNLTSINVSKNAQLEDLYFDGNQVTEIDVTNNPELFTLCCYNNKLTELDVSNNPDLYHLDCGGNQLTELDVMDNMGLVSLDCSYNQLTELNLSENVQLATLYCQGNMLAALDVSANANLDTLYCQENEIATLNVSNNPRLYFFDCSYNQLTELDLSGVPGLEYLNCRYNFLDELNISACPNLTALYCDNNRIADTSELEAWLAADESHEGMIAPQDV